MKLNCISIDDEPLALGLINAFIQKTPFLQLSQSYHSSSEILSKLQEQDFQILFLDIQMPGINGIEIARALKESNKSIPPKIVFTTAYNQFAVESYQVDALDYLLKPFEYEDFLRSVNKAKKHFEGLSEMNAPKILQEEAIFVRSDYQQVKIFWDDIRYIQGLKDYVTIHLKSSDKTIVTHATLKALTEKLPQDRFLRVQKSYIVALDSISSLATNSLWIDQLEINIGEQFKEALHGAFSRFTK